MLTPNKSGEAIRWPHGDGITEFRVEAIDYHTHDEWLVSELITLENFSDAIAAVDAAWAAHLNKWATLSAWRPSAPRLKSEFLVQIVRRLNAFTRHMCTEAVIMRCTPKVLLVIAFE